MKPLEHRAWFVLLSLVLSGLLMFGLWSASGLPLGLSSGAVFLFAALGLWQAVNKLLALAMIRLIPSLGVLE
jgi:hypothetical protein